jgi:hypothetical protein
LVDLGIEYPLPIDLFVTIEKIYPLVGCPFRFSAKTICPKIRIFTCTPAVSLSKYNFLEAHCL